MLLCSTHYTGWVVTKNISQKTVAKIVLHKINYFFYTYKRFKNKNPTFFLLVWLEIFKFPACTQLFWDQDSKAERGSLKNKQTSQNSLLSRWKCSKLTSMEFFFPWPSSFTEFGVTVSDPYITGICNATHSGNFSVSLTVITASVQL